MAVVRGKQPLLIATSETLDEDIAELVTAGEPGQGFHIETITAPLDLAEAIRQESVSHDVLLVDSLTQWLGALMQDDAGEVPARIDQLLETLRNSSSAVIAVATEVGCGIEPETELARRFRDEAGRLNQRCAAMADETYWMVFGCPLRVK